MEGSVLAEREGHKPRLQTLGGWRAWPAHLRFQLHLGKCLLQRKKYPLLFLGPSRGGLLGLLRLQRKLKLKKVVRFNSRYVYSLNFPLFPSKAFDHMVSRGGLNVSASGTPFKAQVDVAILAITRKCPLACGHCYERFNLADEDTVTVADWKGVVRELQELGTSVITFSGGEPMLRFEDVVELVEAGDKDRSDFHLHTSGFGVTREKAVALRRAGLAAAGIGLDDVDPDRHDALRGRRGVHDEAVRALRYFHEAGIFPYVNMCLTGDLVRSGRLADYLRSAPDWNIGAIRWLEPKPYGGYFSKRPADLFSEDDRRQATALYLKANTKTACRDCPPVSYLGFDESPERLGCLMGGLTHFYIDSRGYVEPCVFLPVAFGNIREESLTAVLARMRSAVPRPLRGGCPGLLLQDRLGAAYEKRGGFPIPYEDIRMEWDSLFD
jgi:MoaA/NifB/PqqE/SkfB family radical SAM enzyme